MMFSFLGRIGRVVSVMRMMSEDVWETFATEEEVLEWTAR